MPDTSRASAKLPEAITCRWSFPPASSGQDPDGNLRSQQASRPESAAAVACLATQFRSEHSLGLAGIAAQARRGLRSMNLHSQRVGAHVSPVAGQRAQREKFDRHEDRRCNLPQYGLHGVAAFEAEALVTQLAGHVQWILQ